MTNGKWASPRHPNITVFEKDFPNIDLGGLHVYCPGCRVPVKIARKAASGRIAGWCQKCNRGVTS